MHRQDGNKTNILEYMAAYTYDCKKGCATLPAGSAVRKGSNVFSVKISFEPFFTFFKGKSIYGFFLASIYLFPGAFSAIIIY